MLKIDLPKLQLSNIEHNKKELKLKHWKHQKKN